MYAQVLEQNRLGQGVSALRICRCICAGLGEEMWMGQRRVCVCAYWGCGPGAR